MSSNNSNNRKQVADLMKDMRLASMGKLKGKAFGSVVGKIKSIKLNMYCPCTSDSHRSVLRWVGHDEGRRAVCFKGGESCTNLAKVCTLHAFVVAMLMQVLTCWCHMTGF